MVAKFDEQKYLIWSKFIKKNLNTNSKFFEKSKTDVPLNSLRNTADVHPSSFVSKILAPRSVTDADLNEAFMNLGTQKISAMVPFIKLYKVDGNQYTPFLFPSRTHQFEIDSIMNEGGRLAGAGIKTFSMAFQGEDTFTADKYINCNLAFFVQNMASFFEKPYPGYAPLAELITIKKPRKSFVVDPENKVAKEQIVSNPKGLEIKADVGWSIYPEMREIFTDTEITAIENSRSSLRLTLIDHSFSFTQEGTVEVSAQYIGRLETLFDSKGSDLFLKKEGKWVDTEYFKNLNEELEELEEEAQADGTVTEKEKKKITKAKTKGLVGSYAKILEKLDPSVEDTAIKALSISISNESEYFKDIQSEKVEESDVKTDTLPEPSIAPKTQKTPKRPPINLQERNINYMYLADLVEAVLRILKENYKNLKDSQLQRQIETFRMVLGTTVLNTDQGASAIVPIGEIPISIKAYSDWFKENIIRLGKSRFGFKSFIQSMVSDLMNSVLKKMNFRDAPLISENIQFGITMLTTTEGHGKLKGKTMINAKDLPSFLHSSSVSSYDDDVDFIIFYSYEPDSTSQKSKDGDKNKDKMSGIPHFFLGKDRGLIKNISFSKVDIPFRKEALITQSYDLFDELRMPYNANISMVGNNLFRPGSQIYINPSTIGLGDPRNENSYAVRLGLGGYYSVTSLTTTLNESGLETNLDAKFTGWPENKSIALVPGSEFGELVSQAAAQGQFEDDVETLAQPETLDAVTPASDPEEIIQDQPPPPQPKVSTRTKYLKEAREMSMVATKIYKLEMEKPSKNGQVVDFGPRISYTRRNASSGNVMLSLKKKNVSSNINPEFSFLFNSKGEIINTN